MAGPPARVAAGLFDVVLLVTLDVVVIGLTLRVVELDLQSLGMLPVAPLCSVGKGPSPTRVEYAFNTPMTLSMRIGLRPRPVQAPPALDDDEVT